MNEERGPAKMLRERIGGSGGISEADIVQIAGLPRTQLTTPTTYASR